MNKPLVRTQSQGGDSLFGGGDDPSMCDVDTQLDHYRRPEQSFLALTQFININANNFSNLDFMTLWPSG